MFLHSHLYLLGWVRKMTIMQFIHQCKLRFVINIKYIYKVILDVVPLNIIGIVLRNPYLYDRDDIYYKRENKYQFVKNDRRFVV